MKGGAISLSRKIQNWKFYSDSNTSRVFIELLLSAEYQQTIFNGIRISRGCVLMSVQQISDRLKLTPDKVRTAIRKLIESGAIEANSIDKLYTQFKIVNYDKYQTQNLDIEINIPNNNNDKTIGKFNSYTHNENNYTKLLPNKKTKKLPSKSRKKKQNEIPKKDTLDIVDNIDTYENVISLLTKDNPELITKVNPNENPKENPNQNGQNEKGQHIYKNNKNNILNNDDNNMHHLHQEDSFFNYSFVEEIFKKQYKKKYEDAQDDEIQSHLDEYFRKSTAMNWKTKEGEDIKNLDYHIISWIDRIKNRLPAKLSQTNELQEQNNVYMSPEEKAKNSLRIFKNRSLNNVRN